MGCHVQTKNYGLEKFFVENETPTHFQTRFIYADNLNFYEDKRILIKKQLKVLCGPTNKELLRDIIATKNIKIQSLNYKINKIKNQLNKHLYKDEL